MVQSYAHYLQDPTDDIFFKSEDWIWDRAGLITNYDPHTDLHLKRIQADGSFSTGQNWGIRAYDCIRWLIEMCHFHDILSLKNGGYVGEHGTYCNVAGDFRISNCLYERIAGQAIQTVFIGRQNESSDYNQYVNAGGTIRIEAVQALMCNFQSPNHRQNGRAGFPISCFPSSQRVEIVNSIVENVGGDWWSLNPTNPSSPKHNSYGGIMVNGHPSALIKDTTVRLENPDREIIQMHNVQDIVIEGGYYEATSGPAHLRFLDCGKINVSGVSGNADILVGHTDATGKAIWTKVGQANQGYSH